LNEKVQRTAVEAARRNFSPEFMNRLDKVVVFHPLKREELDEVLEIELMQVQKRVLDSTTRPFFFRITGEGREFLLEEGTDQRYGARHLKRAIERYVVYPIARLLATTQVHQGDALVIDHHLGEEGLVFLRDTENRSSDLPYRTRTADDCGSSSLSGVHNSLEMPGLQRSKTGAQHEHSSRFSHGAYTVPRKLTDKCRLSY